MALISFFVTETWLSAQSDEAKTVELIIIIIIIIIMVIFKCYFSGELIALTKKQILSTKNKKNKKTKRKEEALFKQTELDKAVNSIK